MDGLLRQNLERAEVFCDSRRRPAGGVLIIQQFGCCRTAELRRIANPEFDKISRGWRKPCRCGGFWAANGGDLRAPAARYSQSAAASLEGPRRLFLRRPGIGVSLVF